MEGKPTTKFTLRLSDLHSNRNLHNGGTDLGVPTLSEVLEERDVREAGKARFCGR